MTTTIMFSHLVTTLWLQPREWSLTTGETTASGHEYMICYTRNFEMMNTSKQTER